jgi:kinetochore protein Mis12/MTW1
MAAPSERSTEILTEHLGFPPIALIDDIINAVNGVMYKCTQAVETYLISKEKDRISQINLQEDDDVIMAQEDVNISPENEIEMGTAKLETLLENSVDKNFDKFELYALRNILNIPNELSEGGWIRLRHYGGVQFNEKADAQAFAIDLKINALYKEITTQLLIKKQLILQLKKANKLVKLLSVYRDSLLFLSEQPEGTVLSPETLQILQSISPMDQTLYYLISQTTELFESVIEMNDIFTKPVNEGGMNGLDIVDEREKYLNVEATKLLQILGLMDNKPKIAKLLNNLNNVDLTDEQIRSQLKERFGI